MNTCYFLQNAILEPESQNRLKMASLAEIAKSRQGAPIWRKSRMSSLVLVILFDFEHLPPNSPFGSFRR